MNSRISLGLLVCALLLTGCVGLNTNKLPSYIGFRPVIGHDTRATEESVPFPEDRSFKVWAQESRMGSLYLDNETISYNGGWLASKIWQDDELRFEACWPTDLPVEFSKSNGLQIKNFDCSGGDVDILMAQARSDNEIDTLITLRFDHILSRVEFRMLHSLSDNMAVRLKKIELKGIASKGDFNTRHSGQWSLGDPNFTYVVYDAGEGDGVTIPAGKAQYIGEDFYVIPQVSMAQLDVSYEVRYEGANWIPQTETIKSLDTQWEPSKHYTHTLNLRMDKLVQTTGISSWNNREE